MAAGGSRLDSSSGARYALSAGDYAAEVVQAGATLRTLTWRGRPLILPFGVDEVRPHMRGAVMIPWPGRIPDGRYRFGGVDHQLALTEPATATAIHGLVAWAPFEPVEQHPSGVVLGHLLLPQDGYEFALHVEVGYALSPAGLRITLGATNLGDTPAPYGAANHLYLTVDDGILDGWDLQLAATEFEPSPPPRFLSGGRFPVAGSEADFGVRHRIGPIRLNHSFTGLPRDPDGWAEASLSVPDGHGVRIRWDAAFRWVQAFSYDLPGPAARTGLAVEPMTCPPGAFDSGVDLTVLDPGARCTAELVVQGFDADDQPPSR